MFFALIMIASAFFSVLCHEKIERLFSAVLILFVGVIYLFAIIGIPSVGLIAVYLFCAISLVGVIIISFRKKELLSEYVLSAGFFAVFGYAFIFLLLSTGARAMNAADPNYWIVPIKVMYYNNDLYNSTGESAIHPFFSLIYGWFVEKTWFKWAEGILVFGGNIFIISMLLPIFSFLKTNGSKSVNVAKILCLSVAIFLFPYYVNESVYTKFSVDYFLVFSLGTGVVFAAEFLESEKKIDIVISFLHLFAAILMKRIGIVVVALILLWLIPLLFRKGKYKIASIYVLVLMMAYSTLWRPDKYVLLLAGSLLVAVCYWAYLRIGKIEFRNNLSIAIGAVLLGVLCFLPVYLIRTYIHGQWFVIDVLMSYLSAIYTTRLYGVGSVFNLSIVHFIFACAITMILLLIKGKVNTNEFICFVGLLVTDVGYILSLAYLYPSQISVHTITKYGRYIDSFARYIIVIPGMTLLFLLYVMIKKYDSVYSIALVCVAVAILIDGQLFFGDMLFKTERAEFNGFDEANVTLENTDVIGYIDMAEKDRYFDFLLQFTPLTVNYISELSYYERNANGANISLEDLKEQLCECDYIYINSLDASFSEKYGELFDGWIEDSGAIYVYDESSDHFVLY